MNEEAIEVVLIGDTGSPVMIGKDPVLNLLRKKLPQHKNSAIAFLGDNVYPNGIPRNAHPERKTAELRLTKQLDILKEFKGKIIFLSGNHDWNKGKENGYSYVIRQENFIKSYLRELDPELSAFTKPSPIEINISDYFTIVALNTQWWIQKESKSEYYQKFWGKDAEKIFLKDLEDILRKNKDKRVLILGHLPVYSYALHGGKYKIRHHFFPISIYHKKGKYLPLPLVGSIIPLYRKYLGAKEDMAHPRYQKLRQQLKAIFRQHKNLIYAAGHEHNLQYIKKYHNHFIVSGAGSKLGFVRPGKYAEYAESEKGFFILKINKDRSIVLEAWKVNRENKEGVLAYQQKII